jgi:hypothetical protein
LIFIGKSRQQWQDFFIAAERNSAASCVSSLEYCSCRKPIIGSGIKKTPILKLTENITETLIELAFPLEDNFLFNNRT